MDDAPVPAWKQRQEQAAEAGAGQDQQKAEAKEQTEQETKGAEGLAELQLAEAEQAAAPAASPGAPTGGAPGASSPGPRLQVELADLPALAQALKVTVVSIAGSAATVQVSAAATNPQD